ncbi:hypothetical protein [Paraburkholderia sp. MM5482-R1]|uniref:hypothetical protein n=1 Tax=unclassified Paraburkholderia TaxID=2615204 RepID=UPI003D2165BB
MVVSGGASNQPLDRTPASDVQPEVSVYYLDQSRFDEANRIGSVLKANPDLDVSVQPFGAVKWNFISHSELHFFNRSDEAEAERIVQDLQNSGFDVKARYMPVSNDEPARFFERRRFRAPAKQRPRVACVICKRQVGSFFIATFKQPEDESAARKTCRRISNLTRCRASYHWCATFRVMSIRYHGWAIL